MNRYIGISLNDDYAGICVNNEDSAKPVPTVVCKVKKEDRWLIGEEAYKATLSGDGIIVDKLLNLLKKEGTATIDHVKYSAIELLAHYFAELLRKAREEKPELHTGAEQPSSIIEVAEVKNEKKEAQAEAETVAADTDVPEEDHDYVVVSLRQPEKRTLQLVKTALIRAGVEEECIRVISHTESFAHFVLHQDSNLYNRLVGMFELSNQCLYYYEMQVSRGSRKFVLVDSEQEEEAFNLDILKTTSGGKIADKILSSLAERVIGKKYYSAIFLSGRGFEDTSYCTNFMNLICNRRRVLIEPGIFAIGAELFAKKVANHEPEEYTILCDTRVSADISIRVVVNEKEMNYPIVTAGESWVDTEKNVEMILDDQNYIDFQVNSMLRTRRPMRLRMLLDEFPKRENRTTRVRMSTEFVNQDILRVTVRDMGFGDLVSTSGKEITEEIDLSESSSS